MEFIISEIKWMSFEINAEYVNGSYDTKFFFDGK